MALDATADVCTSRDCDLATPSTGTFRGAGASLVHSYDISSVPSQCKRTRLSQLHIHHNFPAPKQPNTGMPITLPTPATTASSLRGGLAGHLKARIFRRLDFSATPGKFAAVIVLCRAFYNILLFVAVGYSGRPLLSLLFVVDQLVVMYSVSTIAEAVGTRTVLGVSMVTTFRLNASKW